MDVKERQNGEDVGSSDTELGVDLANAVFQLHGASMTGHLKSRVKLAHSRFRQFTAVIAAQRPEIRFVARQSHEHQAPTHTTAKAELRD